MEVIVQIHIQHIMLQKRGNEFPICGCATISAYITHRIKKG